MISMAVAKGPEVQQSTGENKTLSKKL